MPDYTKTIIYKLINYDYPELVYVGSTRNFTKRKQQHKESCLNEKSNKHNLKVYTNIRENDGWENWNMIKICDYPCNNRREAELEEDKYMMELKANMNMIRASRTLKQQYVDKKEKNNKKCKEYNEAHKEEIQQKNKEYRENNKEKIKDYKNEKIKCDCGCEVTKSNLKQHQRTKKHIKLMK